MFHSIRWRLVASFTLLTLLTVGLLGLTVLTLMRHTLERLASDQLKANAEAVARQSEAMFQPIAQADGLYQLAYAASFLGDAQVRILDPQNQVLADSGSPAAAEELTWFISGSPGEAAALDRQFTVIVQSANAHSADWLPEVLPIPFAQAQPSDGPPPEAIMVRRMHGPWGDRLAFPDPAVTGPFWITSTEDVLITSSVAVSARPAFVAFSPIQVTAPIQANGQVVGYVEMTNTPDLVEATLGVIRRAFMLAAAAVTVLAIGVALVVSRGVTAPLASLAAATSQMNQGDLSARAPVHGRDEIGLLARQFNQMAAALEQTFGALAQERDALRRFIADASHELRTPITALRTFIELLQGNASQDTQARGEFLVESAGQISRLERITSQLLDLSRLEGGIAASALEECEIGEVITATVATLKTVAREQEIELQVELPAQPVVAWVDRRQIETALLNLLDNALKFTPAGGQVQVGCAQTGDNVSVWVNDNGSGITADELPYIFERFHRGRHTTTGSGLGLAIVQSIVQAHGGRVEVVSQSGLGSRFTVVLPRSPSFS